MQETIQDRKEADMSGLSKAERLLRNFSKTISVLQQFCSWLKWVEHVANVEVIK